MNSINKPKLLKYLPSIIKHAQISFSTIEANGWAMISAWIIPQELSAKKSG